MQLVVGYIELTLDTQNAYLSSRLDNTPNSFTHLDCNSNVSYPTPAQSILLSYALIIITSPFAISPDYSPLTSHLSTCTILTVLLRLDLSYQCTRINTR